MRQIFPRGGSRLYAPLHEQTLSGRLSRAAPIPLLPFYSSNIYLGEPWAVRTFSGSVAYCPQSAWIQNTTLVRLCNSRRLTQTDEDVGGCGGPCALRAAVRGGEVLARH
ncbi:hypothetical protein B0H10DRAFT_2010861 [Mycena sp. CBHHK59/15]|nr:hypothetical protein B0H10DRAFT_2010861 [Mycena sp. CBHHK59/15]